MILDRKKFLTKLDLVFFRTNYVVVSSQQYYPKELFFIQNINSFIILQ